MKRKYYIKSFCNYTEYPSFPDLLYQAVSLANLKPTVNADHLFSLRKDGSCMFGCEAKRWPAQIVQVKNMGLNIMSLEHLWPCPKLIFLIT